jgi:DNA-binding protein H-NS
VATKLEELQQKIDALQKERDDLLAKERNTAIERIRHLVNYYGINLRDLDDKPAKGPKRAKAEVKYKSGNEVWSGRGRKPKWVEDHLAKGGKLEDLLVK